MSVLPPTPDDHITAKIRMSTLWYSWFNNLRTFLSSPTFTSATVGTARIRSGTGSPAGVVSGNPGDLYLNTSGGSGTTLYVKESGTGTTGGWVGK